MNRALTVLCLFLALTKPTSTAAGQLAVETYTLPNGLTVILHEDHTLAQVAVNIWYKVGSKDEAPGRTGFAHLFEHLMFMGTTRVPGNQFDVLMESGGGANNASTGVDRTNYYSWGPTSLLPTLLWLDADRMEGLGKAMTQEKLDLQRSVVRNERRQNYENRPYALAWLAIPEALYPAGHPYHHAVIGSHEDLAAATLEDVKGFFATYYVPGNASLVVAGDFEPAAVKKIIGETLGAVPPAPIPSPVWVPPASLDREVRRVAVDKVKYPRLFLAWHSPAAFSAGDAAMDLIALMLSDGSSGRLFERLVLDEKLAQDVTVFQYSKQLGSELHVEATATENGDLEKIKRVVLEELERFQAGGPTAGDLARAKASTESSFLRRRENLRQRADMLNEYFAAYGAADSFDRDLARRLAPTAEDVATVARSVFGRGRVDLRILPADPSTGAADLDKRPPALPSGSSKPPLPEKLLLANGIPVLVVSRPGSGLFSGALVVEGGERVIDPAQAGLAELTATLLTKGAGERDAAAFAEALASLGGSIEAQVSWHDATVTVSGLASRMEPTLDLFADAILRPRLAAEDFARERDLAAARIRARDEDPSLTAAVVSGIRLFGRDDPRGRPSGGYAGTVAALKQVDAAGALPQLLDPARATFVFVGDVTPGGIVRALDARLGAWKAAGSKPGPSPQPLTRLAGGGVLLVHRPGAPQTLLTMVRPVASPGETQRAVREAVRTLFGGAFTSRLNQNIREKHGFSYGAHCRLREDGPQWVMAASSSVQTAVTAAALTEFKREFDVLARGDITADELDKAVRTVRFALETRGETTGALASLVTSVVSNGQPLDLVARQLAALPSVTLEAANAEARSGLFDWGALLVVMVGDKDAVLPQLAAAGFPSPEIVDGEGNPLAP